MTWHFRGQALTCHTHLVGAGLYNHTEMVLDVDGYYNLASEYLKCSACGNRYISWSNAILDQPDVAHRSHFPALLTYQLVIHLCTELLTCLVEFPPENKYCHTSDSRKNRFRSVN